MTITDFTYLIENPVATEQDHMYELEKILEEYPFFQAAKALHLKGLKNQNSYAYNTALKNTAAHTTDRSVLFDFITSEIFIQNNIAQQISAQKSIIDNMDVTSEEVIEVKEADLGSKQDADTILDPALFQKKETENQIPEEAEALEIGKPLEFDKSERHSFSEWLKLSSIKPVERNSENEDQQKDSDNSRKQKFDLIDKFIASNPKISPVKETTSALNLAKRNLAEKSELMTETLAKVYLEQKKYKKAIQAYKILSLKYPEKSGFFADQIRAVKKLQQKN